jgi:hypothetical protein
MLEITLEQVKAAALDIIREVGKEHGYRDVDPMWWNEDTECSNYACQYTLRTGTGRKPACLVGRVLFYLGVELDDMIATMPADELFASLRRDGDADVKDDAAEMLWSAQRKQDLGATWFYSLVEAGLVDPEGV